MTLRLGCKLRVFTSQLPVQVTRPLLALFLDWMNLDSGFYFQGKLTIEISNQAQLTGLVTPSLLQPEESLHNPTF